MVQRFAPTDPKLQMLSKEIKKNFLILIFSSELGKAFLILSGDFGDVLLFLRVGKYFVHGLKKTGAVVCGTIDFNLAFFMATSFLCRLLFDILD